MHPKSLGGLVGPNKVPSYHRPKSGTDQNSFSSNHSTPIDDKGHHVMRSSRHPKASRQGQNSSSSLFKPSTGEIPNSTIAMAKPYVPHDVLDETAKTSLVGLGSGFFIAAIQNALSKRNVGAMSVFTRGAPIIGICGMN